MRFACAVLFLLTIAVNGIAQRSAEGTCKVRFAFVYLDRLENTNRGIDSKHLKSVDDKIRKYGDVCYTVDESNADYVFFVHTKPAVYHGYRTLSDTSSHTDSSPVNGTITDQNGNMSTVSGTVDTTTTTTTTSAVPYDVDYSVFILNVLIPRTQAGTTEKTYTILRTFDQKGLYHTIYGIGYGKGKHPIPVLIEDAVKWLHENNLGR